MALNKEELESIGVDIEHTMERFLNNEALYMKFLKKVEEDPNFEHLRSSLAEKDYKNAVAYAHTLKGVTANLGLNILYNDFTEMVKRLREDDVAELDQLFTKIEAEYNQACKVIRGL